MIMGFYVEFHVESDSGVYTASWSHVPIRGVGETPTEAIGDLQRKLGEVLRDRNGGEEILKKTGYEIINTMLAEMARW